jgi:hypothetical protein
MEAAIPLQHHWAVEAVSEDDRNRAVELIKEYAFRQKVGLPMALGKNDEELLDRMALAYEMAGLEGLGTSASSNKGDGFREQTKAIGYAFDIRCMIRVPEDTEKRILHVLQLSALAWIGSCQLDLRDWFVRNRSAVAIPPVTNSTPWDQRVLYRLFECWVSLFRNGIHPECQRLRKNILELRAEQREYEKTYLEDSPAQKRRANALRLIALYQWSKATELLIDWGTAEKKSAEFALSATPGFAAWGDINKHFEASVEAAAMGDIQYEMVLHQLHAAAFMLVMALKKKGTIK